MLDPRHCPHPASDVVLVEEGSECVRCGLVAATMPAPGPAFRASTPVPERAKEHIADIRADLVRRRERAKAEGRRW